MQPPPLFALGFGNLPMLYGLGAASLPIIIHLLNRRKFRETRWAAMRFLLAAVRKNARRVRLEQWLLLAVRTLLVIVVVAAMARPFLESVGAIPVLAGRRMHRVIVLDGSMSMAYAPAEATRFERAKALAAQLVKDSRRGDALSLVVMADPPRVVIGDPSPNHAEVLKELEETVLPHGGTDLTATFAAIDRVLEASAIPQKEVVFLTDLQAASWRRPGGDADALKRALARLEARRPRSIVVDLGEAGEENRAVTALALEAPVVTAATSTRILATARNFGTTPARGVHVRLILDGQLGPDQVVDLPPGEDVVVPFPFAFDAPGDHLIEARIDDDPQRLDNRRYLAVPVKEALDVLLVDGDPKAEPFAAETDYLAQALNPGPDSSGAPASIRTEVVAESGLSGRELAPYDAVALCNIARFSRAEVAALDAYLRLGGGVVFFGGDRVMAEDTNPALFAEGKGLLPAKLGPTVGGAERKNEGGFALDPLGFRHPIVAPFGGADPSVVAGLTGVRTWQYHKLQLPEGARARVALAFGTGDPAVVEAPRHRGTVLQVATTADADWTSWPLHPSYPPVMEQMVLQAASGRLAERNVLVGQPLDQALPAAGAGAAVSVHRGYDGRTLPARLGPGDDVSLLHFEDTELTGPYRVRSGPPLSLDATFAANPLPAESDPAKLDRAGLQEALPGWSFAYFIDWQGLTRETSAISQRGELHRQLLWAALALLLIETVLAWRFGHHATAG